MSRDRVSLFVDRDAFSTTSASSELDLVIVAAYSFNCRYPTPMSKQPRSGLGTVKRDWTANSQRTDDGDDSDVIAWSPSPPPYTASTLTPTEKRLKAIEEALRQVDSSEQVLSQSQSQTLVGTSQSSQVSQKRRVDSSFSQPAAKKRQLPSSWADSKKAASQPEGKLDTTRSFGSTLNNKKAEVKSGAGSSTGKASSRIAGVFLSAEQNHILKLVQDGQSVFYTGSAGESNTLFIAFLFWCG